MHLLKDRHVFANRTGMHLQKDRHVFAKGHAHPPPPESQKDRQRERLGTGGIAKRTGMEAIGQEVKRTGMYSFVSRRIAAKGHQKDRQFSALAKKGTGRTGKKWGPNSLVCQVIDMRPTKKREATETTGK